MDMNEKRIRTVVEQFAEEVKKIFGTSVQSIILYGSCARHILRTGIKGIFR